MSVNNKCFLKKKKENLYLVGTDGHLTEFICEQTDRMCLLTTNVSEEGEGESQVTYRSSLPGLKNVIKLIILI